MGAGEDEDSWVSGCGVVRVRDGTLEDVDVRGGLRLRGRAGALTEVAQRKRCPDSVEVSDRGGGVQVLGTVDTRGVTGQRKGYTDSAVGVSGIGDGNRDLRALDTREGAGTLEIVGVRRVVRRKKVCPVSVRVSTRGGGVWGRRGVGTCEDIRQTEGCLDSVGVSVRRGGTRVRRTSSTRGGRNTLGTVDVQAGDREKVGC